MLDFVFTGINGATVGDYDNVLTLTLSSERAGVDAAPSPVWFECTAVAGAAASGPGPGEVYDPQYHEITYLWDFGDAANATPVTTLLMPSAWKNINIGYGRRVAHCYNDNGTYTVTCYAYEPATRRFGSETIEVTVANPDTVFAGNKTILYDPDSLYANSAAAGLTGATVVRTWAAAKAAHDALGSVVYARTLFAPGAVLTMVKGDERNDASGHRNMRFGALDIHNPSRPVINSVGREGLGVNELLFRDRSDECEEMWIYGIDINGDWDSTTETGFKPQPFQVLKNSGYTADQYFFGLHRVNVQGVDNINGLFGAMPANVLNTYHCFNEVSVTNWQDYGILVAQSVDDRVSTAIIGSAICQHPDALSGGPKNGLHNNHGAIRDFGSRDLYISVCDTFSRNGWSGAGQFNGVPTTFEQETIRLNTTGKPNCSAYIDRVYSEGAIKMTEQNVTSIDVPGNYVFDKMLFLLGPRVYAFTAAVLNYGGVTFRNLMMVKLNMRDHADANNVSFNEFLSFNNSNGSASNGPAGVRVYNATGIDLRTDANAFNEATSFISRGSNPFSLEVFENNLFHEPNRSASAPVSGQTIDLAAIFDGITPRHRGPRHGFESLEGTFAGNVSGAGGTLVIPYSATNRNIVSGPLDSTPTTQAYWTALPGTDNRHIIAVGGSFDSPTYHATRGDIDVDFGATEITITNNSGVQWNVGQSYDLKLDRTSLVPAFTSTYDTRDYVFGTVDATDPDTLSSGDTGLYAYSDYAEVVRPDTGRKRGAVQS